MRPRQRAYWLGIVSGIRQIQTIAVGKQITLSQIAYRTLREYMRAALGEPDASPGAIVCIQSFGSLAHWHPHLHVLDIKGRSYRLRDLERAVAQNGA